MGEVLTISKLNQYVKSILHEIPSLSAIEVRGEIINLKRYASAVYFTLKEGDLARISAVSFNMSGFPSTLKDGDEVVCRGQVSLYEKGGTYQLIARDVNYYGLGAKLIALQALKVKLEAMGLFDTKRKLKLPRFPKTIGVIVPKDSAAQSDIVTNIGRRYPLVSLKIAHAVFQGENATPSLISAFTTLNERELDVLIIARGGGSSDDLWAFNDETLILALSKRKMPLISAIGHEIDTTLVDYLADVRASTPTAAAELSVPDINELRQDCINLEVRLSNAAISKLDNVTTKLNNLVSRPVLTNFTAIIKNIGESLLTLKAKLAHVSLNIITAQEKTVLTLSERFSSVQKSFITNKVNELKYYDAKLVSLNPRTVLNRGYAFISKGETIITSAAALKADEVINITFNDGVKIATVNKGEEDE